MIQWTIWPQRLLFIEHENELEMNQPVLIIYFHSKLIRSVQHSPGHRPVSTSGGGTRKKIKSTKTKYSETKPEIE